MADTADTDGGRTPGEEMVDMVDTGSCLPMVVTGETAGTVQLPVGEEGVEKPSFLGELAEMVDMETVGRKSVLWNAF